MFAYIVRQNNASSPVDLALAQSSYKLCCGSCYYFYTMFYALVKQYANMLNV